MTSCYDLCVRSCCYLLCHTRNFVYWCCFDHSSLSSLPFILLNLCYKIHYHSEHEEVIVIFRYLGAHYRADLSLCMCHQFLLNSYCEGSSGRWTYDDLTSLEFRAVLQLNPVKQHVKAVISHAKGSFPFYLAIDCHDSHSYKGS